MTLIVSIVAFFSAVALSIWLLGLLARTNRAAQDAFVNAPRTILDEMPWLRPFVTFFAFLNSKAGLAQHAKQLQLRLVWAGRPGGYLTAEMFLGIAELIGCFLFVSVLTLSLFAGFPWIIALTLAMAMGIMGGYAPFSWLAGRLHERTKLINRAFPYFLDLVVMAMGAGSTFLEAVRIYVEDNAGEPLAGEFRIVLTEITMGKPRREALLRMLERIRSEDVENSIRTVIQGEEMGTPLDQILAQQAEAIRFKRSQRAERVAEEIKVRIQGPVILLMAAIFLLILGPAIVQVVTSDIM